MQPSQTIPYNRNGIVIREPIIRLGSPPHEPNYRGKGKGVATETEQVKSADPFLQPQTSTNKGAFGGNGESSRTVRRRLFEDPLRPVEVDIEMAEPGEAEGEDTEPPLITTTTPPAPPSSLYTWTRFQNSLHDLLNDESSEPVLFARDAPLVIESVEETGKLISRLYYTKYGMEQKLTFWFFYMQASLKLWKLFHMKGIICLWAKCSNQRMTAKLKLQFMPLTGSSTSRQGTQVPHLWF